MIQVGSWAWFIGMIHFTLMIGWLEYHKNGTHQNGLFCSASLKYLQFCPLTENQTAVFEKSCILPMNIWISWDIHLTLSWVNISRNHTFTATLPQPLDLRNPGISWWLKVPWHREDQRALLFLWIQLGAPRGWIGGFFFPPKNWVNTISVCLFVYWICFWNRRLSFCCVKLEVRI